MLQSSSGIMQAIKAGDIVVDPFDIRQLQTNSYDLRLGEAYFIGDPSNVPYIDFGEPETLRAYWGEPRTAKDGIIVIPPGGIILAHSIEIAGGRNGYTSKVYTRSTPERAGQDVCKSAGLGDVGFISRWTFEITNHLTVESRLRVGMRIAQIAFFYVGRDVEHYQGSYGQEDTWTVEDMLPSKKRDYALP